MLTAGLLGLITHLLISGLSGLSAPEDEAPEPPGPPGPPTSADLAADTSTDVRTATGTATPLLSGREALYAFLFLELMDASFSFDGVIGAFAFTSNLFVIAAGLGVGALAVRTLTVRLVRRGTLSGFAYLEHGAHYAIGLLGALLLASAYRSLPELLTGLLGVGVIAASLASSVIRNRTGRSTAPPLPI